MTDTSTPPTRLAVLDDYQGAAPTLGPWGRLTEQGVEITFFRDHLTDPDALAERLAPFDGLVVMRERTPFPRALIERLPMLRLLITTGGRNRSIDLAACQARGITVCGTPSVGAPTAELTWGLIIALSRSIPREDRLIREGRFQTTLGTGIEGRTLGIIGLGKLGSTVAGVARAFGMTVLAWSPNLTAERAAAAGAEFATKEELLRRSDYVTLHLVLSERTRHVLGAAELALMRPTAFLVNTSRGPLVDEDALVAALRENRIAGAGLDVFAEEPLPPGHPLLGLANTVLTPHLGYVTRDNYAAFFEGAVECVEAYRRGTPIRLLQEA